MTGVLIRRGRQHKLAHTGERQRRAWREGKHVKAKERGLRLHPTCWHLGLGLLISRTVRNTFLLVKPPDRCFVMASSADPYNPKPTLIFKYKTVFSDVISKKKNKYKYNHKFQWLWSEWNNNNNVLQFKEYVVFFKGFIYLFLERGERRRKGRERKSLCGCLSHAPHWGPGSQPRHVPWLGVKMVTLCFAGQRSIHWATTARGRICSTKIHEKDGKYI